MKTLIKPLLVALSLSFVAVSFSEAKPVRPTAATFKTGIYSSVNSKLNIALDKQAGGPVDIQFKRSTGEVLYSQHLGKKEASFRTRLNLDDLADGDYVVEITNGVETTRQTVTLKTKQPVVANRIVQTESVAAND
jgi:hypothetical protein